MSGPTGASLRLSPSLLRTAAGRPWSVALLLAAAVLALHAPLLSAPARHDELYHLLAARGLLETGEPRIADGLYVRGYAYTRLAAWAMALFGDHLAAARLPALVAAALVPASLFLWLQRAGAGAGAALGAAALLATSPFLMEISAFARFYSLQVLAVFAGAVAIERAQAEARPLLALPALPAFALALHLHPASVFVLAGLVPWGAWVLWPHLSGRLRPVLLLAGVAVLLAVVLLVPVREAVVGAWRLYRTAQPFQERFADAVWFYHAWYQLYYPAFWTLTPLLVVPALRRGPGPAFFALCLFASAFVLASFAAAKGTRYLAAAQPFLFALWALGLAAAADLLRPLAARLPERIHALPPLLAPRRLLPLALAGCLLLQPFWVRSAALLAHVPLPFEVPDPDWERAAAVLRPWAERAEVVVSAVDVYALAHLGRHDIGFEASKYGELRDQPETPLRRDPRTGRPVAGDPAVLERILGCYRSGLFVAEAAQFANSGILPPGTRAVLERHARALADLQGSGLVAYVWERRRPELPPGSCRDLPPSRPPQDRSRPWANPR